MLYARTPAHTSVKEMTLQKQRPLCHVSLHKQSVPLQKHQNELLWVMCQHIKAFLQHFLRMTTPCYAC